MSQQRHQNNPQATRKVQREHWLFHAYLYSGLRLSELIRNNTSSLQSITIADKALWTMNMIGKGGQPAELPVPRPFMEAFYQYRVSLCKPLPRRPWCRSRFFSVFPVTNH